MKRAVFRKLIIVFLISSSGLYLVSCEDFFHSTAAIVEEANKNNDGDSHPKRIFLGGSFTYNSVGFNRQSFAVLDGYGHYDYGFFQTENAQNGINGGDVRSIKIMNDFVYVAGAFTGYETDTIGTLDSSYQRILRYSLGGNLSTGYTPGTIFSVGETVVDIEPLSDNSLFAGGNFSANVDYNGLIKFEPDGSYNTTNYFDLNAGVEINSFSLITEKFLFSGGFPADLSANPAITTEGTFDGVEFLFPGGTSGGSFINDIEISPFGIFAGGSSLIKYTYNGTGFEVDTAFNTVAGGISGINAIAVADNGFIYVGGTFMGLIDPNGNSHDYLIRLYPSGYIDPTFQVRPYNSVHAIEIQKNGYIMVGGSFTGTDTYSPLVGYMRLTPKGTYDNNFNLDTNSIPGMTGGTIYAFAFDE